MTENTFAENAYIDSGSSPPRAPERFVSAAEAAQFLSVSRRHLLELARRGLPGAYPMGTGTQRKIWVFRLSELAGAVTAAKLSTSSRQTVKMPSGSLRAGKRIQ